MTSRRNGVACCQRKCFKPPRLKGVDGSMWRLTHHHHHQQQQQKQSLVHSLSIRVREQTLMMMALLLMMMRHDLWSSMSTRARVIIPGVTRSLARSCGDGGDGGGGVITIIIDARLPSVKCQFCLSLMWDHVATPAFFVRVSIFFYLLFINYIFVAS